MRSMSAMERCPRSGTKRRRGTPSGATPAPPPAARSATLEGGRRGSGGGERRLERRRRPLQLLVQPLCRAAHEPSVSSRRAVQSFLFTFYRLVLGQHWLHARVPWPHARVPCLHAGVPWLHLQLDSSRSASDSSLAYGLGFS
eukprot:1172215-Prorocentrum_minimum.AAC.1